MTSYNMLFVCLLVFATAAAVTSPTKTVGEMAEGCGDTVKFASDPASLAAKVKHTAELMQHFQDKSKLPQKNFTLSEVARCDGETGRPLYIIVDDLVYDITEFTQYHPAGPKPLKRHAGRDATSAVKASGMSPELFVPFVKYFRVGTINKAEKDKSSAMDSTLMSVNSRL